MNRLSIVLIVLTTGVMLFLCWFLFIRFDPNGPDAQRIWVQYCPRKRDDARLIVVAALQEQASGDWSWSRLLQGEVDQLGHEYFRCPACLHAYAFNPDPAAWADEADPATILIVCPGPHHGNPDNLMFATTSDGTAVEIPRDEPPAWFDEGVRAEGVEGKE